MSKKILFMNSAKLTAISLGVLLVIFCTIGMSFTPGEEGDNVGNPNDSTYVSGPRRSHWNPGGCGSSDHNNKDYARTQAITTGHGTVSISNTTKNGSLTTITTKTSTNVADNAATIDWNCNASTGGHVNSFDLTATPDDGYYFAGWSTSNTSNTGTSSANPWNIQVTIPHGGKGTEQNKEYESSSNPYGTVYYAYFGLITYVDVSFSSVPEGCSYDITVGGSTQTVSANDVVKTHITEAKLSNPVAASGYVFAGWYQTDASGNVMDITSESPTVKFSENVTLGARFISTSTPKFKNITKGVEYYGLKMATMAASANDIIIPVADETVVDGSDLLSADNGIYTIPSGVKLLIPYSSANDFQTLPKVVTSAATLSPYKKLILMDGVNVVVNNGAQICIAGQAMAGSGGSPSGYTTGACGVLDMSRGGHMELNDGSTLYCWGFVKGQDMDQGNNTVGVGTISVNSGATVWETFSVGDWRGGSATSSIVDTRFFPFQSYFMQNIEVPTTYWEGSSEWCYFTLNATGGPYDTKFAVIGSSNCLFKLTDAQSKVRKWYDPTTDLMCYELSGSAVLDELKIKITGIPFIGTIDIQSSQFDLPIPSNMHLILANCNMNLTKPLIVQPGAIIEIKNSATVTLSTNLYMYDKDDWGPWVCGKYFKATSNLTTHKNRGDGSKNDLLDDAKFIIDSGSSTLKWYKSTTTSGDGETGTVAVNNANPCNEDESYTKAIASTTFYNVYGRWFKSGNQNENADHTYNFTYIASGAVSGTGGTDVSPNTHNALYAPDKTGLTAGMKWCNVAQDGTCSNIFNATQALNETPASDIRYTYPTDSWLQLLKTETEGVYGGSDNSLYAVNCLYTINDVKKALVDGHFVALEKNTEDEAWHDVANPTNYYISFAGCTWHPATKYAGEEKAYIVEGGDYIWYNNDWLLVEREDPFFFDYNDQNVKRYYEYEDGAWVLASPRVRVVDAIETREFYKLPEAITVASGKKNTTITILKDISGINTRMTYTAKNTTCTLNLNGHTVSGAAPFGDDNNRGLLIINASGTIFTITDNSANKEGRLENICNQNKVTYAVHLMAGTLNVEHGTIHAENPAQYASKDATVNDVAVKKLDACGARAVQVAAAQKLNLNGGRLEAYATRNAYGIVATGNTANTTVVTIEEGAEVYAEAPYGAYGISCSGKLNMNGGLVEAKLNDHLVDASYVETDASNNLNKHAECYAIHMSASANKTASSCYYGTLTVTGGTIKASSDLVRSYTSNVTGIRMYYSVAGMGNRNFASTSGTNAEQACAIGSVKNAEILVQNNANYGYGILVYGHYNSYNKTNSVFKVENTTVDVKAFNYAYGVYACGGIDGTTGECFTGDVELTNCTIAAEATNATTTASYAYGAWVYAGATTIFQDKQANYYGEYATAAKMTINGGSITAKTKTHYAYTAGTNTRARSTYGPQTSVYASRTRGGNAEAYPTLIINGGTYRAISGQQHARGISSGGNTTVKDAIFHVTAGTYNTYGLYAISGKLTATNVIVNDTAKSHSSNNANVYGVLVDCSIPSGNTAQTGFAYAGEVELNNCTITAVSPSYSNARALYVNATNKVHNWTQFLADSTSYTSTWAANKSNYAALYRRVFPCTIEGRDSVSVAIAAKATVNGGTFTAKAGKASAYGAVSTQTSVPANKEVTASPEMTLKNASFSAQTGTSTTAYGVQAGGPTLIEGCTITATAGNSTKYQSTASGVRALDKTTTIKNSTITATATDAAYGLEGSVEINATHGYCWHGEFDLSEAGTTEVTAEAKTKAKTSYAIYLKATKKNIASGNFAGDYATASNAIINGGTYNAKFNTSGSAYVISLSGQQTQGSVVAQPEVEVLDGFFNGATAEVGTAGVVGHMQLKGGYFVHPTNLATYAVAPKSVWTLPNTHEHYDPYKYKITEHYTVTFKNGSTQLQQDDLEVGSTPSYTGTPTKAGDAQYSYTFDGWSTTDGGDKLASLPAVTAAATYFAHFTKTEQKYAVTVVSGGHGSVSPASVSEIGCETASADITATPDAGYKFDNWTLPEGVTAADGYTVASNPIHIHATATDKSITANFAAKNYTVTLNNQSATTAGQASVAATYDAVMPSIAGNLPARTGYIFGGYYSADKGGGTQYYNANGASAHVWDFDAASPTLYAKWTAITYNVRFNANGGSGTMDNQSFAYDESKSLTSNAFSKTGYAFVGWAESASGEVVHTDGKEVSNLSSTQGATVNLYAKWAPNTNTAYTVKHYKQNIDGTYSSTPTETENRTGTTDAEVTPAVKNYQGFTAPDAQTVTILADGSLEVTYNYTRNNYTLTIGVNEASYGSVDSASVTVPYGSPVTKNGNSFTVNGITVKATPAAQTAKYDYALNQWNNLPNEVSNDVNVQAVFTRTTRTYAITWKNKDGSTLRVDHVAYDAIPEYGSVPTCDPTKSQVFEFRAWTPEITAVEGAKTYTADYTASPRQYPVIWKNYDGSALDTIWHNYGWEDIPSADTYDGETPTRPTESGKTYTFNGWSDPVSTVAGGDVTYTAQYLTIASAAANEDIQVTEGGQVAEVTVGGENSKLTIGDADNHIAVTTTVTVVENGGELVVSDGSSIGKEDTSEESIIIVESGGQLTVESTASVEADVFELIATHETTTQTNEYDVSSTTSNYSSGQVDGIGEVGDVAKKMKAYFKLSHNGGFKARQWYAVAVPWQIAVPTYQVGGVAAYQNGVYKSIKLGSDYDLVRYDGGIRAERGNVQDCWVYVEDDIDVNHDPAYMHPGVFYMIYLAHEADTIRFERASGTAFRYDESAISLAVQNNDPSSATGNDNWNGIANPTMHYAYVNANATLGQQYVVDEEGHGSYDQIDLTTNALIVGQPVFVQTTSTSVVVNKNQSTAFSTPSGAPRRVSGTEVWNTQKIEVQLVPTGLSYSDRVFIQTEQGKADRYTIGADVAKAGVSAYKAQMWINRYDYKLCYNTVAPINNSASYPLGISIPKAGEYAISVPEDCVEGDNIYLTIDGRVVWNLSFSPYVADFEKGTTTRYGIRLVRSLAPAVTTDIENAGMTVDESKVQKILLDDQVYILRGGNMYSVEGQMVK